MKTDEYCTLWETYLDVIAISSYNTIITYHGEIERRNKMTRYTAEQKEQALKRMEEIGVPKTFEETGI
ncbi:MAG: hypothetical protein RR696_14440, partial [Clostridia bacterium]